MGIHIVDEFSGSTEWPNKDGRFDLSDFRRDSYMKVEGRKRSGTLSMPIGGLYSYQTSVPSSSTSAAGYSSIFRFVLFCIWNINFEI